MAIKSVSQIKSLYRLSINLNWTYYSQHQSKQIIPLERCLLNCLAEKKITFSHGFLSQRKHHYCPWYQIVR